MLAPITMACIVAAAHSFAVPEVSLWTILQTEHGRVGACSVNTNGSHDCGPAQVNVETWGPYFSRIIDKPNATVFYLIRDNGCFNITAAALILRLNIDKAKGDVWDGMGRYNSATPSIKSAYQSRLIEAYRRLTGYRSPAKTN